MPFINFRNVANWLYFFILIKFLPNILDHQFKYYHIDNMFRYIFLTSLSFSFALLGPVSYATTEKLEEITKLVSEDKANNFLRQMSSQLINNSNFNSNFEHLVARVGVQNKEETAEILAVYGLQKSADTFLFNQTSLSRHDGEDTFNTGFGYRFFQNDAVVVGVNGFFDFELDSGHRRVGSGVEFLTEKIELRGNYYHPTTSTKTVNGINEEALKATIAKVRLFAIQWRRK